MTRIVIAILVASAAAFGQSATSVFIPMPVDGPGTTGARPTVRAGCTPDSMAAAKAGSLAARELGRWQCYAQNLSAVPQLVSHIGFSLDFIELHQIATADVADIFATKQAMNKYGKAARALETVGVVTGIGLSLSGITIPVHAVAAIGAAVYGSGKLGDYFNKQVPPSTNALAGQWGPADTVLLQPGQGIAWKVYASKMHGATAIGPRLLTPVPVPTGMGQ